MGMDKRPWPTCAIDAQGGGPSATRAWEVSGLLGQTLCENGFDWHLALSDVGFERPRHQDSPLSGAKHLREAGSKMTAYRRTWSNTRR